MAHIEIDEEVLTRLESEVHGFNQTPNDVLRRILGLNGQTGTNGSLAPTTQTRPEAEVSSSALGQLLASSEYRVLTKTVGRYLKVLSWLRRQHTEDFDRVLGDYKLGSRVLLSRDRKEIEQTGKHVTVKALPGITPPYFAMVTLDDNRKKVILSQILALFGYSVSDINAVTGSLSPRRHGGGSPGPITEID